MQTATATTSDEIHGRGALTAEAEALLEVPAGFGGCGAWLDAGDAPALAPLLASCREEVALVLGERRACDAARLLEVGAPGMARAPAAARHVAGLFDARGEMTAFIEVVRDHTGRGTWSIPVLLVRVDLRNCGIGGQLVEAVERWARTEGARALELHVRCGDVGALRFALRSGFEDRGPTPVRSADLPEQARMIRRLD
ncbi:MAG: GNAT family N-acetyltransferase [Anaeromyxobacteraceae bacterium]